MKWLHLSNALQFLTSRRDRETFFLISRQIKTTRDIKKNIVALSVFIFCVPQPRPNIGKYQPGQFAYANAYLRDTYSMRASCELQEVVELVCKCAVAHRLGGLAFGWRPCLWQEVFMYLAATSSHCLHTRTTVNHRQDDFLALCKSRSEDSAAVAHPGFKETKVAWDGCRRWIWKEAVGPRWNVHLT